MSMLDQLAGSLLNSVTGGAQGSQNPLLGAVMGLIEQQGGLSGLISRFQSSGLGDQAASWVSTGTNLPINAEQLQAALGSEAVSRIASQLGVDASQASGSLADLLPTVIDKLTPNGQVEGGDVLQQGLAALGGLFQNR